MREGLALPPSAFSPVHEVQGIWRVCNRSCTFVVPGMSALSPPEPSPASRASGEAIVTGTGALEGDTASPRNDDPVDASVAVSPAPGDPTAAAEPAEEHDGTVSGAVTGAASALGGAVYAVGGALSGAASTVAATAADVVGVVIGAGEPGTGDDQDNDGVNTDVPEPAMSYLRASFVSATGAACVA